MKKVSGSPGRDLSPSREVAAQEPSAPEVHADEAHDTGPHVAAVPVEVLREHFVSGNRWVRANDVREEPAAASAHSEEGSPSRKRQRVAAFTPDSDEQLDAYLNDLTAARHTRLDLSLVVVHRARLQAIIASHGEHLEVLRIGQGETLDDEDIESLADLQQLRELRVTGCRHTSVAAFWNLRQNLPRLQLIETRTGRLERADGDPAEAAGAEVNSGLAVLTHIGLEALAPYLTNTDRLSLQHAAHVFNASWLRMADGSWSLRPDARLLNALIRFCDHRGPGTATQVRCLDATDINVNLSLLRSIVRICPHSHELVLGGSAFTNDCLQQSGLATLHHLQALGFNRSYSITPDAVAHFPPSLLRLVLDTCEGEDWVPGLARAIPGLTDLRLRDMIDDLSFEGLSRLTCLRTLALSDHINVDHAVVRQICDLPELTDLRLDFCDVTDAAVAELTRLEGLQRLDLAGAAISDVAFQAISRFTQLTHLGLACCAHITNMGLTWLRNLPLRSIDLRGTRINEGVLQSLPHLERIVISPEQEGDFSQRIRSIYLRVTFIVREQPGAEEDAHAPDRWTAEVQDPMQVEGDSEADEAGEVEEPDEADQVDEADEADEAAEFDETPEPSDVPEI